MSSRRQERSSSSSSGDSEPPSHPPSKKPGPSLPRGSACVICRRRKLRCDGVRPTCAPCAQFERECVYGAVRPSGPQPSAVLNIRLAELRERFNQLLAQRERQAERHPTIQNQIPITKPLAEASVFTDVNDGQDTYTEDEKLMFDIVFENCHHCGFFLPRDAFYDGLMDSDPKRRPHKCLLNAMLLVGMEFASTSTGMHTSELTYVSSTLPSSEAILVKTRNELNQSLANVDRLEDYLAASALLLYWYFRQTRLQEAQHMSGAMARLMVACQLHQVDASVMKQLADHYLHGQDVPTPWDNTLLGRPCNIMRVGYRISLFWLSYFADKILATVTGLPSAYEDSAESQITSVWTRPLDEYESGIAFNDYHLTSISELLQPNSHQPPTAESRYALFGAESVYTLKAKALTFVDRATRLSATLQAGPTLRTDEMIYSICRLQQALDSFVDTVPVSEDYVRTHTYQSEASGKRLFEAEKPHFTSAWVMTYVAQIQVYRAFEAVSLTLPLDAFASSWMDSKLLQRDGLLSGAEEEPIHTFHDLRVRMARKAVDIVRQAALQGRISQEERTAGSGVGQAPPIEADLVDNVNLVFSLISASMVLIEEMHSLERMKDTGPHALILQLSGAQPGALASRIEKTRDDLVFTRRVLESLSQRYPFLLLHVQKFESLNI